VNPELDNGDLAFGESGWLVLAHNSTGVRWAATDGELVIDGSAAVCGPSGSLVVFSPRRSAAAGEWLAEVTVSCSPPALVDLSVVAGEVVPVPGPAPTPAPYELTEVGESPVRLRAARVLSEAARTVGLRVRAPSGCRITVRDAEVRPTHAPQGAEGTPAPSVAVLGATSPFRDGALIRDGERHEVRIGARGSGPAELRIHLEDRYRGGRRELVRRGVELTEDATWLPIKLPSDVRGCFALIVDLEDESGRVASTAFRYLVDVDAAPLGAVEGPWALTIDTLSLDVEAELLDLLGVRHVRVYSGFTVYDLPAALGVRSVESARAMVDGLHFIGAAAGTPAALAARAVAGVEPGRPNTGWPQWRLASAALADADPGELLPVAALLDPLRGRTLVAEMGQLDDPAAYRRVVEAVAAGTRGRDVTWLASNEPDLWQDDSGPDAAAEQSRVFAAAVRAADPDAQLVGPALADGWDGGHQGMRGWDWLERWVRAGGIHAVDVLSVHLHMLDEETQTPEREHLAERVVALRARIADWCAQAGADPKPLWITEMGWRSLPDAIESAEPGESGPAVSEADQADLLVRAAVTAAAAGVERFYAFHLTGFRPTGEGHRFAWGLLSGHVGGPKPAFAGLRQLTRATAGLQVAAPLATSERVRAVPFLASAESGTDVHIVWQWSGGAGLWSVADPPSLVRVSDLMGAPSTGDDLRKVHIVTSPTAERVAVQTWLRERLAARHGEPDHQSQPLTQQRTTMEELHVSTA
jgi:hypothetical protein